ncbi:unnamed protein product, partial [Urochloa humidicola]
TTQPPFERERDKREEEKGREGKEEKGGKSGVDRVAPPEHRRRLLPLHQTVAAAGEGGCPQEGEEHQLEDSTNIKTPPTPHRPHRRAAPSFCFFSIKSVASSWRCSRRWPARLALLHARAVIDALEPVFDPYLLQVPLRRRRRVARVVAGGRVR